MQKQEAINLVIELQKSMSPTLVNPDCDTAFVRARMIIKKIFGESSDYLKTLEEIKAIEDKGFIERPEGYVAPKTRFKLHALFTTMHEDLEISNNLPANLAETNTRVLPETNKVFIVHGHDEAMKQAVARTLEKLGLELIILHEKPNQGRTIIEKFSDYADVSFAVVLVSPDDLAYSKDETPKKAKFRARQNVILELGYFLGKLGRTHVTALFKKENNFEIPSDYSGVLFIPFDDASQWRFDLVKELQACGFDVDANKLTK